MTDAQDFSGALHVAVSHHRDPADASSDSDRTEKGADSDTDTVKGDDAVDTESDTTTTPDSSPPSSRHASLSSDDAKPNIALGSFDKDGNWVWLPTPSEDTIPLTPATVIPSVAEMTTVGVTQTVNIVQQCDTVDASNSPIVKHEVTPTTQWGPPKRIGRVRIAKAIVTETGEDDFIWIDGDDWYNDYTPRPSTSPGPAPVESVEQTRTIVIPVRIRVEDDTSSDEGEASGSEVRRQASPSKKVVVPKRKASVKRGGRRQTKPATLEDIWDRIAQASKDATEDESPSGALRAMFGDIEVTVTPPAPELFEEKPSGVRFLPSHTSLNRFYQDATGRLRPPPFEHMPGLRMQYEAEQRALSSLKRSQRPGMQRRHSGLDVGLGTVAPPLANGSVAAATMTRVKSSRGKRRSDAMNVLGVQGCAPPIPPRRRSVELRLMGVERAVLEVIEEHGQSGVDAPVVPNPDEASQIVSSPIDIPKRTTNGNRDNADGPLLRMLIQNRLRSVQSVQAEQVLSKVVVAAPA
ncbi:hypothetical protein PSEUBRA_004619 [Kalmanozyma brasiliensis GHG001]|uniref:uncharacterized protein n=1 Tax=Kalmanozyma brasiliensis (strain GHG001) TaxID=1365824 RepID=UPI002867CF2F|nr:uncharacterized protein PSEUBRA_004619 [Kalmanozyma brasiliensis GHG001]KAF6767394.1 hypothetical protein PSEUBRA_004619 [Kalmanozyma brasiliensis GHG001]